jgi:hypothetical protein
VDRWLLLHLTVGVVLASIVPVTLQEAAKTVLLPLAGVLVGMSFAWVGSALALAQSEEIDRLSSFNPAGYENYVHPYQAAILVILVCISGWGLAGLGVYDLPCPWNCSIWPYRLAAGSLYALSSMSVRECWNVVMGAQLQLLFQQAVKKVNR